MENAPRSVHTIVELQDLLKASQSKRKQPRVVIDIIGIDREKNKQLSLRTDQYLHRCGCKEGMLTALTILLLRTIDIHSGGWLLHVGLLDHCLLFFCGALAGKICTRVYLWGRLQWAIQRLHSQQTNLK